MFASNTSTSHSSSPRLRPSRTRGGGACQTSWPGCTSCVSRETLHASDATPRTPPIQTSREPCDAAAIAHDKHTPARQTTQCSWNEVDFVKKSLRMSSPAYKAHRGGVMPTSSGSRPLFCSYLLPPKASHIHGHTAPTNEY